MTILPLSLLAVIHPLLLLAEAQQQPSRQLALGTAVDLNTNSLPNPPTLSLPSSSDPIYVSLALCANSDNPPRIFVTNDTTILQPGSSDVDNVKVFEVVLGSQGYGSLSGLFTNGGILSVEKGSTATQFELLASAADATSELEYPLVGDTTSNQALIYSPPFSPPTVDRPSFPNYTLPAANLTFPPQPSSPTNYSLVFASSSSSSLNSLPRTACAIRAAAQRANSGIVVQGSAQSQRLWLRDAGGWRWEWVLDGLTAHTNYTAFTLQTGQVTASSPVNFITKSASFNCPLVHALPFCPSTSYAVPIAQPRGPATTYTSTNLPGNVSDTVISILANFTVTLTTLACGRDLYSPLVSCADCQDAYRTWLCAVAFPRCGEAPPSASSSASVSAGTQGAQVVLPALQSVSANATPRNMILPAFSSDYQTLLPCLETCNAADRACPAFLGFKCPLVQFTAGSSYGVGFIDSGADGQVGGGSTGIAQDVYGNVFCNSG